jgi:DNA-damage-inducible protein D
MKNKLAIFEDYKIRRVYDENTETWYFSVVDIIRALLQQSDYQTARKYWKVLKGRLGKEGSQLVTNCYQLKMTAEDGKQRLTDVATPETLLRLIQSVPSPKAEPIKSKPISRNAATTQRNAKPNRYFQKNQCRFLVKTI